jgi:ABC-2 type transport system ATP-binding protein
MEYIKVAGLKLDINSKPILNNIDFTLEKGKIVVLLGPNGSGKTTLLKALNGLIKIKEGKITDNKKQVDFLNKSILVFDEPVLYEELTGMEHIHFIMELNSCDYKKQKEQISYMIQQFELKPYMNKLIGTYSLGTKKKIQFLCALLCKSDIILMDEYISGLDPQILYSVKKIMREYVKEGHTILLSTHMLDMAEKFCDDVILINEGRVVSNGTESIGNILGQYGSLEKYYITKALPASNN